MSRPDPVSSSNPATVFAALGDPLRLALLARLTDGAPRSISRLADGLGLTRQGVTKHLIVLERAGIVSSRRRGRESHFALEPSALKEAQQYLARASAQWDDTVARFKAHVED